MTMTDIVKSKNGIRIRMTEERWFHITENHDDLAGYYDDVLGGLYRKSRYYNKRL